MKLAAEPGSSSRAPACVPARVWSLTREAAFDISFVGCVPRKAQGCLTHFPTAEEKAEEAGWGKGRPFSPNALEWLQETVPRACGRRCRPLAGYSITPCWSKLATSSPPWGPLVPFNHLKFQNCRWVWTDLAFFWVLRQMCFLCTFFHKKLLLGKPRPLPRSNPGLEETLHVVMAESTSSC